MPWPIYRLKESDWPEVREVESDMRETAKSGKVALLLVRI